LTTVPAISVVPSIRLTLSSCQASLAAPALRKFICQASQRDRCKRNRGHRSIADQQGYDEFLVTSLACLERAYQLLAKTPASSLESAHAMCQCLTISSYFVAMFSSAISLQRNQQTRAVGLQFLGRNNPTLMRTLRTELVSHWSSGQVI
jgi:hypothetical protein